MEKENYYLLLDLPFDPPENDPKKIEQAIKKKQAQWSRYRNHPTKAIKAKQLIGLIPEIRKVMTDPKLRAKEAAAAKQIQAEKEKEKFKKLDRHIEILMAKGHITESEVTHLATIHGMRKDFILKRISAIGKELQIEAHLLKYMGKKEISDKELDKIASHFSVEPDQIRLYQAKLREKQLVEIDNYLNHRKQKGYITDAAIEGLAELYRMGPDQILRRVKFPVKKEEVNVEKIKPIDATIKKMIEDNLKIVGKSSLYDFLDLFPGSSLELLQQRAKEKEVEIRKIQTKDARTTASGALAGHCIAIFRDEASRQAYDMSRARPELNELHTCIELASKQGKIAAPTFDILVKTAVQIGMDPQEAILYVRKYCDNKKIGIEKSEKKKRLQLLMAAGVAGVILLCVITVLTVRFVKLGQVKKDYDAILINVEREPVLEAKLKLLKDFADYHGQNKYTDEAKKKIKQIQERIRQRDLEIQQRKIEQLQRTFQTAVAEADKFLKQGQFDQAMGVYKAYLEKFPKSIHKDDIVQKMAEIPQIQDDWEFQQLKNLSSHDLETRITAYMSYLRSHPNGKHVSEVNDLLTKAIDAYYKVFLTKLDSCEKKKDWNTCARLCQDFIQKYDGHEVTHNVRGLEAKYLNNIQNEKDLEELKYKADQFGMDYLAAKQVYLDYLNANPESSSYIRAIIEREVNELDKKYQIYMKQVKEWEQTEAYCKNSKNDLDKRVNRLQSYVEKNESGIYIEEARSLLTSLLREKEVRDEKLAVERMEKEWRDLVRYTKDSSIPVGDRLKVTEQYIQKNPSGKYIKQAHIILDYLKQEKVKEDQRIAWEKQQQMRIASERKQMRALVQRINVYKDNGNDTVTDQRTGLTWCLLDSMNITGRCLDYPSAVEYVKSLRTGGYTDWRLPTPRELVAIYKNEPFFPAIRETWYWTSEVIWHGWLKKAHIVSTKRETVWNKDNAELTKCGTVRAVRP